MASKRAPGEGTIHYDVARDRWQGRLSTPDGKRRKLTAPTRKALVARMDEARRSLGAGMAMPDRRYTVGAYLDGWLTEIEGTVATTTLTNYRDVVRIYITPNLGRHPLVALTPSHVTAMMRTLERAGKSANTQRLARSVLRRALRRAEADGTIARNVAAIADGPKVGAPEGRSLDIDEARALLASLEGHRLEAAFVLLLSLGLRRGELLGLTWDDVKLNRTPPTLTVNGALKRANRAIVIDATKTKSSRRTLHLPDIASAALREHKARQRAEQLVAGDEWVARPLGRDLVFRNPFGVALDPDTFRQTTYAVTEAAGVGRRGPHELRHSAASLLIAQGVPLKTISEALGHSSIRITADVYGHLFEPSKSETASAMQRALG